MAKLTLDDLHGGQKELVRDIFKYKTFCISSTMGFGKTLVCLVAAKVAAGRGYKTLIAVESQAAKTTWKTEHLNLEYTKDLRVGVFVGTPKQREKLLDEDFDVYIVPYTLLKWMVERKKRLPKFDLVFADEANIIKGGTSKFRKALCEFSDSASIRIAITGTPRAKDEMDFFGIMRFIDLGATLGPNITSFYDSYCRSISIGKGNMIHKIRSRRVAEQIRNMCAPYFRNYAAPDKAVIPIETHIVRFDLSPASRRLYDEFDAMGMKALEKLIRLSDEEHKPFNKVHHLNKLSFLTSGFIYRNVVDVLTMEEMRLRSAAELLAMRKAEAVDLFNDRQVQMYKLAQHIARHHPDSGMVICYNAKQELAHLKQMFPNAITDTDKDFVDRYNNGNREVLLLQYQRSGKALNLQHGGNVVVFYSMVFDFVNTYQIVRRVARQGQKADKVHLYILLANNTRDEAKLERIEERERLHEEFAAATIIRV